jgi:hypothetical protein
MSAGETHDLGLEGCACERARVNQRLQLALAVV